ncbi:MAG: response regulator transcription factor [Coriobacteriia bacterium]|nr:response regulator transcription factor [Coriobacteriia bacterium]
MGVVRVLLVGAQRASLEALATSLDTHIGIESAGVLTHVPDIGAWVRKRRVSVVLIEGDLLAEDPTCQPVRDALASNADVRVVVLGGSPDVAAWALCEGACGFVPDNAELADVNLAVRQVAKVGVALPFETQVTLLARFQEVGPSWSAGVSVGSSPLTARELEIVRLIADGGTNASVAAVCGISESTVKNHLANIFRKLGTCSRSQMVAEAFRRELLNRGK